MAVTTNGSGKLNLDEIHRARREKTGLGPAVTLGGVDYVLPATIPASLLVAIGELQAGRLAGLRAAIAALFGDDQVDAVLAGGFEIDDFDTILGLYGEPGFSPASGGSS